MDDNDPRGGLQKLLDADPYDTLEHPDLPDGYAYGPVDPDECPNCGGRGVIAGPDADGNYDPCPVCEGSAIDPASPASPL